MLKYGDKIIYIEGVLVELEDEFAALDLKGRLGYLRIPKSMLLYEHPLVIGQEFGWNTSFPEQTAPGPVNEAVEHITSVSEGELFTLMGTVYDILDGGVGIQLASCPGIFRFPKRMLICDYEITDGQPVGCRMTAPKQLSAEPNSKYVSNHEKLLRRQAEMQAKQS